MRHNLFYLTIVFLCSSSLVGCNWDLVETKVDSTNEFSVIIPATAPTLVRGGTTADTIKAQIRFPGQKGTEFDVNAYTYTWIGLRKKDTLSTKSYLTVEDFENQDLTLVSCFLTVREKSSGIAKQATIDVFLSTPTREGWMLLGDKNGEAKISVLTYSPTGYRKYIDIEKELGLSIPLIGNPISIRAVGTEANNLTGKDQYIGVVTDQEAKLIRTRDFTVNQFGSDYLTKNFTPSAASPLSLEFNGEAMFVATKNNKTSLVDNNYMLSSNAYSVPINFYRVGNTSINFKASPYHTVYGGQLFTASGKRIMYDLDSCVFVKASSMNDLDRAIPLKLTFSLKGFELKALTTQMRETNEGTEVFSAFLHHPVTKVSYVVQFTLDGSIKAVHQVSIDKATDILASKFLEIDYNNGYLIYTKGNEVIGYDYKIGQAIPLLNFGSDEISVMKMEKYISSARIPGRAVIYKDLMRKLVVCTYNPAKPNTSGTFRLYQVPLGHQSPLMETEEVGFPKLVDVSFASIPHY